MLRDPGTWIPDPQSWTHGAGLRTMRSIGFHKEKYGNTLTMKSQEIYILIHIYLYIYIHIFMYIDMKPFSVLRFQERAPTGRVEQAHSSNFQALNRGSWGSEAHRIHNIDV